MEPIIPGDRVLISAYGVDALARSNPAAAHAVRQRGNQGVVEAVSEDAIVILFGTYSLSIKGKYLDEISKLLVKIVDSPATADDSDPPEVSPMTPMPAGPVPAMPGHIVPLSVQACQWTIFQFLSYKSGHAPRVPAGYQSYDEEAPRSLDAQEQLLYHTALKKLRAWIDPDGEFSLGERMPTHGRLTPPQ